MQDNSDSLAVIIIKSVVICFFILCAVIGNGSVLYAIRRYPKLKTVPNFFVFNLAIADLLFSLTGMPMIVVTTVSREWVLGDAMCDFGGLLNSAFCTTSIWTLVHISLHRYFAVAKPMRLKTMYTKRRTYAIILGIWVFSFAVSTPPLFGWGRFAAGTNFCTVDGRKDMTYSIFLLLADYFFPFLFLTILYLKIFFLLRKHEKTMKKPKNSQCRSGEPSEAESEIVSTEENVITKSKPPASSPTSSPNHQLESSIRHGTDNKIFQTLYNDNKTNLVCSETKLTDPVSPSNSPGNNLKQSLVKQNPPPSNKDTRESSFSSDQSEDKIDAPAYLENNNNKPTGKRKTKIKRKKSGSLRRSFFKEVRVTKMLLIVVCGFFLCWTPFLVASVLYAFKAAPPELKLLTVGIYFACLNSIINPVIYALMNQNFRFAFQSMWRRLVISLSGKRGRSGSKVLHD